MKFLCVCFLVIFAEPVCAQHIVVEGRWSFPNDISNRSWGVAAGYSWKHFSASCLYTLDSYDDPFGELDHDYDIQTLGTSLKFSVWKRKSIGNILLEWNGTTQVAANRKNQLVGYYFKPALNNNVYRFNRMGFMSVFAIGPTLNLGNFQLGASCGWTYTVANAYHFYTLQERTRKIKSIYISFGATYYFQLKKKEIARSLNN